MDIIGILTGIGVNETFLFQVGIFSVTFYFLIFVVLRPYQQALIARRENTEGSEEQADKILNETAQLQQDYASVAQRINSQIKDIYDSAKTKANNEANDIMADARQKAEKLSTQNSEQLNSQIEKTRAAFNSEVPDLSGKIVLKLMGKEG